MILGKYKTKKRLGKGAYGDVLLVQDANGKQYALKLISNKMMEKQKYLFDYLQGEIQCMKNINSPYIMKLYENNKDNQFHYLFCEYCDGGDLLNYQAKQKDRVFTIQKAIEVLVDVVKGLYELHNKGYLHRDIKPQNILVKTQNGKQIFKLADFGYSKKCDSICNTILGTENFMSPEIFKNQEYGYEVDMWAFGVLLFFMLNMEFPFKINPMDSIQKKRAKLELDSENYSYKKAVQSTKKKLVKNCTPEIEDLFNKIFNSNVNQRIKFSQIRQHPLFIKYFADDVQQSKILYGKKFKATNNTKKQNEKPKQTSMVEEENVRSTYYVARQQNTKFPQEKTVLETKKDQIDFLRDNATEFYMNKDFFKNQQRISLTYNLLKYYLVLLKEFIEKLKNPQKLKQLEPNLKWKQFSLTKQFAELKKQAEQDKNKYQIQFEDVYYQCQYSLKEINLINDLFKPAFTKEINDRQFDGAFKFSYRKSTHKAFNSLRELIKSSKKSGNKLNYNLAILVISHVFNHIFMDAQNMQKIFAEYFAQKKRTIKNIDYSELREWMTSASASQLNNLAKQIIQLYFS